MKKSMLAISVAAVFATVDVGAFTLPAGAVLSIDAGSQFNMGASNCSGSGVGDPAPVPLSSDSVNGSKGLYVGANMGDFSSGSHGGGSVAADRGAVTDMWLYFSNTGVNYMSETVGSGSFGGDTNPAVGADMSGWIVGWNGIASIPMGGCQYGDTANNMGFSGCDPNKDGVSELDDSAPAVLTCGVDCSDGDTYTITHTAHVPAGDPSNFGGVKYDVCLVGIITAAGSLPANTTAPTAGADSFTASANTTKTTVAITQNDTDPEINDAPSKSTLDLDPSTPGVVDQTSVATAQGGTVSFDPETGVLTYDPMTNFEGIDTFSYTIKDFRAGMASSSATVTITVGNVAPVANDDLTGNNIILPEDTFVDIDVLANDTDANNNIDNTTIDLDPGTPGQQSTVTTTNGTAVDQGGGIIKFTVTPGFSGTATDTFSYTVMDTGGVASGPLESNAATVGVFITVGGTPIAGVPEPYIVLNPGNVADKNNLPAVGDGSWFSMELKPGQFTYTPIVGLNHIRVSETITQPALSPNMPNIDNPWIFFGNVGLSQTTKPVKQLTNDVATGIATLDFSGWDVSWNAIPSINLGSGQDNGIATLTCYTDLVAGTQGNCSNDGEEFILTYRAIVPPGDVSGFGGVNYVIHFEGYVSATAPKVGCLIPATPADVSDVSVIDDCTSSSTLVFAPGLVAQAAGNTTGRDLIAANIGVIDPKFNPKDGEMCVGGCLDFIIEGVATDHVDIVVKLNSAIPDGGVYRKLVNGRWQDFNTTGDDQIGSQDLDGTTGNCQGPQGEFNIGLRPGAQCLYLRIYDGGLNDADGLVNGTIVDPSGVLFSGSPNVPPSSTDGCSISSTPVNLIERADWLLVAGFLAVMGLFRLKRTSRNS